MITGILVALPEELYTLTKAKLNQGECFNVTNNILIMLSGAGPDKAEIAAQSLIKKGANQLISWGCAGALAPYLKAGDLVIPSYILIHNGQKLETQHTWSKEIINTFKQDIQCYDGGLLESSSVITSAQDKMQQFKKTHALAVDMESGALSRVAKQENIPYVAIRSIVDPAELNLPNAINHAMTDKGVISISKLMLYLGSHPSELPRLIKLGLHFKSASKSLKHVASQLTQITQAL